MDDEESLLEYSSEVADPAETIVNAVSPYQSERESICSDDSYAVHDDLMEATAYDSWDDSYYLSTAVDDFDGEISEYEDLELVRHDTNDEPATIDETAILPKILEIDDETLEENNNDPNNNMDSIETFATVAPSGADRIEECSEIIERNSSPRPGCSKDSFPMSGTAASPNNEERSVTKILHLISKINRYSILRFIEKNPNFAIGDLKIWDLLPENERVEHQRDVRCSTDSRNESASVSVEDTAMKIVFIDDAIGTSDEGRSVVATASSKVKRGPDEDICTIGCKKSSSEPDISIPSQKPSPPSCSIPKIASTSEIAQTQRAQRLPIMFHQSEIIAKSVCDDETKERKTTTDTNAIATVATVVCTASTVTTAAPTISAYRPNLQFPPVAPAIQARSKFLPKSQNTLPIVPTTVWTNRGAIPQVRNAFSRPQPTATADIVQVSRHAQVVGTVRSASQAVAPAVNQPTAAQMLNERLIFIMKENKLDLQQQQRQQQVRNETPSSQRIPHAQQRQQRQPQQQRQQPKASEERMNPVMQQRRQVGNKNPPSQRIPHTQLQQQQQQSQQQQQQQQEQPQQQQQQPKAPEERANPPMQQPQQQQSQNTNRVVCMDMYYKLRNIFPNVDREYIKKLCPPEWGPGDRDAQLAPLIEHLLEGGEIIPTMPIVHADDDTREASGTNEISGNVDDVYETLLGIFPDADPHYLREFAEKNVTKSNVIKDFVESKLENREYPTRDQYMARLKITEQQRQYTSGFGIKQFLTIIPDPTKHFMDPKRKCQYNTVAFEFLKIYFNKTRVNTISSAYCAARYNLSLTAANLERIGHDMKTKRGGFEMPTENILLLQEIAFIKHKREINEYLENVKSQEAAEFKMLKEQNFLIECQCCYDTECVPSKCSSCEKGHSFCNSCVINGTSSKMGEGETRISCFMNCGSEFSLSTLQQVLAPTTFSILLKKRQAAEVIEAGLEGLVSCPFCHFASIPPEEDKVFKCLNPECTKESCRLCKELSHVPLRCDEVMKADKARRYIEEKMTEALARKCYKCQRAFFKEEGCNKITCPCGASMCYLCDQPIENYTHFRGQGSDAKDLCPLYSDTIRLDAVAVREVARQAQMDVMRLNPNVKIDTAKLLPAIPRRTPGPHTDVLNADELPRRAQRVLDQPEPL